MCSLISTLFAMIVMLVPNSINAAGWKEGKIVDTGGSVPMCYSSGSDCWYYQMDPIIVTPSNQ